MDSLVTEIIDISLVLSKINNEDLYSSAIQLFQAMNFPVSPCDLAINVEVNEFIFSKLDKRTQFSSEELKILKSVKTISLLFLIHSSDICEQRIINHDSFYSKIAFIGVDLDCDSSNRSQDAYFISKIIGKAYSYPVFFLFRHLGFIMFSGLLYEESEGVNIEKVYLSDWFVCQETDCFNLQALYNLPFGNHRLNNIAEMYEDMVFSIAREYYKYIESKEYLTYGVEPGEYGFDFLDGYNEYPAKRLKASAQGRITYFAQLYGDDYVEQDDSLELLLPEDDDWIVEELEGFNFGNEEESSENEEDLFSFDDNPKDEPNLPDGIDESLFSNPVELLKWLDEKD